MARLTCLLFALCLLAPHAYAKSCVLSLYKKGEKGVNKIDRVFGLDPDADVFEPATIKDITYCFTSRDYSEIVWLSHGMTRQSPTDYSAPLITNADGSRFPILLPYFQRLIAQVNYTNLKKFRIEVCNIDYSGETLDPSVSAAEIKVHSTIDVLMRALHDHGVELDLAPIFKFGQRLLHQDVTRVTYDWLTADVDRSRLTVWRTESNMYCKYDSWEGCDRNRAKWAIPIKQMKP